MKKIMKFIDFLLDGLKRILVRFKNAKFGLLFIINIFSIPDFITDRNVSIISKFKVIFSLGIAILYIVSGIDFIPEMITGVFGFIDDILVVVWSLGIVNEELAKYKKSIKENIDPNIIEGINFHIKDDKE
ncbi:YkvA family protein [Faecalimicrobium sp. JNUCC 81]